MFTLFCVGSEAEGTAEKSADTEGDRQVLVDEGLPPELTKQEMLVQYLHDAYTFSAKITEALSMVSRMMYESSVSGKDDGLTVPYVRLARVLLSVTRNAQN